VTVQFSSPEDAVAFAITPLGRVVAELSKCGSVTFDEAREFANCVARVAFNTVIPQVLNSTLALALANGLEDAWADQMDADLRQQAVTAALTAAFASTP
jgi:hypothetical protein